MGEAVDADLVASAPAARNRRGERTRQELIAAAWRVADEMSLVELLAGLTPSVVASEAGMTTGAFRHHFADTANLVAAMVDEHLGNPETTYVVEPDEVRHHVSTFDAEALRAGVAGYWALRSRPEERERDRRSRLLASRGRQTTMPDGKLLADLLA
jgi:AcrR family transcriptional regulator